MKEPLPKSLMYLADYMREIFLKSSSIPQINDPPEKEVSVAVVE